MHRKAQNQPRIQPFAETSSDCSPVWAATVRSDHRPQRVRVAAPGQGGHGRALRLAEEPAAAGAPPAQRKPECFFEDQNGDFCATSKSSKQNKMQNKVSLHLQMQKKFISEKQKITFAFVFSQI